MERDSREFYLREAENIESEAGKEIFLRIAKEEDYHVDYIGSIIKFVERAEPGNWLETAEWYHKDEYLSSPLPHMTGPGVKVRNGTP